MATFTETIEIGDDSEASLSRLLSRFPKGRRLRVVVTDEEPGNSIEYPSLDNYRSRAAAARLAAPPSPWDTTEEAIRAIRNGEDN